MDPIVRISGEWVKRMCQRMEEERIEEPGVLAFNPHFMRDLEERKQKMKDAVRIEVSGPDHAGKGLLIALITHHLRELGISVLVQSEDTHNGKKLAKEDEELLAKFKEKESIVVITEMQTK